MKLTAAEAQLKKVGLRWQTTSHKAPNGPYNTVTSTSPPGGTKEAKHSVVTLKYNVPPSAKTLPSVAGLSVAAATAKLHAAGWKNVITGTTVASLKYAQGDVVSTNPPANTSVALDQQIVLKVSGGGTAVPALVGLSQSDAISSLNQAGLAYSIQSVQGPPGTAPGTVWKTTPNQGKAVRPGGTVTVYVEPGSTSPSPSPSSSTSPSPSPSSSASPGLLPRRVP
jgi:serine/threonine-protein kinase